MEKLVIIGGGFAGAKIAKKLEDKFEVMLIDEKSFFEFTPGILRSIINPGHLKKIEVRHKDYLKNAKFIKDCAVKIKDKKVFLKHSKSLDFDYLVVASGSSYKSPIKVRDMAVADRGRKLKKYHKKLEDAKNIVIVGGGLVGVEMAGEILEAYKDKNVKIIQGKEKLMERNHPRSIKLAQKFLKKKGVEIIFSEKVSGHKKKSVVTDKGNKFSYDFLILCTGIKPNSEFLSKKFLDEKGFIKVNKHLQMKNREDVFVCGDVAGINEEKTAQGAEKQADAVIKNLLAIKNSRRMKEYKPRRRPMVISLGKYNGIFEWRRLVFSGIIPAFMKWAVERKTMMRYKN